MNKPEIYRHWLFEGLTYRLGDVLIGICAGAAISIISFLCFHTSLDLGLELGVVFAFAENLLNTGWYYLNRYLWSRTDKS